MERSKLKFLDINCNKLDKRILNARNKAMKLLFEEDDFMGLSKRSTTFSFIKCTLIEPGLIDINNENQISILDEELIMINKCLGYINNCIHSYKNVNFSEVYNKCSNFGICKELVTFYLAFKIKENIRYIIIYKNNKVECDINSILLEQIEKFSEEYSFYISDRYKEDEQIINALINKFNKNFNLNKNKNIYHNLMTFIQNWFWRLPNYSKQINKEYIGNLSYKENISITARKLIRLLKMYNIYPYDFFSNKLKDIYVNEDIINNIYNDKIFISNTVNNLKKKLIIDINNIFKDYIGENIITKLQNWLENLNYNIDLYELDINEKSFISYIKNIQEPDDKLIESLGKMITGLSINDWNDDTPYKFINEIINIKKCIEEFKIDSNDNYYQISLKKFNEEINKLILPIKQEKFESELLKDIIISHMNDFKGSLSIGDIKQVLLNIVISWSSVL